MPSDPPLIAAHLGTEAPQGLYIPLGTSLHEAKRLMIIAALKHTKNNKTEASRLLGITLKALFNNLHAYGLFDEFRSSAV